MPSLTRRRLLATLIAAGLVATGGLAYAAIPDSGGVIHTCYTKPSGAWRVIDVGTGQSCKSNEAALDVYSKGGADALFLDQAEANALYLGMTEKAADSDKLDGQDAADFLGTNATAADSARLGGFTAGFYVLGGGVRFMDAGDLPDGGSSSFTCCAELDLTPPMTVDLRCDTSGNTTLVAFSPGSFRWWWDGSFGNATPVATGFQAEFGIGNGVARNSLRTTTGGIAVTYDLDTFIGSTCNFGWTWDQAYHATPN
jgi:hypothetical protein